MQNVYDNSIRGRIGFLGVRNYLVKLQRVLEETGPFRWK
jgi:hypothetical protein